MANKKTKKKNAETQIWALPLSALLGIVVTAAATVAITLIFGKLAFGTDDPSRYASIIGSAARYLSAFLGGLFSCAHSGRRFGATFIHAAAVCLIMMIVGMAAGGTFGPNIPLRLLVIPCSLLGGAACYLKVSKKKKPRFKGRSK